MGTNRGEVEIGSAVRPPLRVMGKKHHLDYRTPLPTSEVHQNPSVSANVPPEYASVPGRGVAGAGTSPPVTSMDKAAAGALAWRADQEPVATDRLRHFGPCAWVRATVSGEPQKSTSDSALPN